MKPSVLEMLQSKFPANPNLRIPSINRSDVADLNAVGWTECLHADPRRPRPPGCSCSQTRRGPPLSVKAIRPPEVDVDASSIFCPDAVLESIESRPAERYPYSSRPILCDGKEARAMLSHFRRELEFW